MKEILVCYLSGSVQYQRTSDIRERPNLRDVAMGAYWGVKYPKVMGVVAHRFVESNRVILCT